MPSAADVSVVICAYTDRRWVQILDAVASAAECQTQASREILLVIDHNDALLKRAQRNFAGSDGIHVIPNRLSRGLSGARNTGLSAASGRIVAFLDDDAVAEPDWLDRLIAPYADASVIGTGGAIEAAWEGGRPSWFPVEFDWVVGCTYLGLPHELAAVRNVIGCSMSFLRDDLVALDGFRDEVGRVGTRPTGCDETELSIRALAARPGARIMYEPLSRVRHFVPSSRATWRYFWARCFAEGISKAAVSRLAGADRALSSERSYVLRVLPRGVLRGLWDGIRHRDRGGPARAAAILTGLATTVAGYAYGNVARVRAVRQAR